jgi:predicted transcriptional regulator
MTIMICPALMNPTDSNIGRPHALSPVEVDEIVKLKAQGVTNATLAKIQGVSVATIGRYLKSPEAQEKLEEYRGIIRHAILRGTSEGLVDIAVNRIKEAETAKDFDAATRGLLNLEKAATSASGEAKKVEMTGPGGEPLQIDIRAILARAAGA